MEEIEIAAEPTLSKDEIIGLNKKIQKQFNEMCSSGKLFRVKLTGQEIWDMYIKSFSTEDNPTFRDPESSTKNCNLCKSFIRRYGNIVSVDKNFNITTMFDVSIKGEYENTAKILTKAIKSSEIVDVFFETFDELNSLPYESCKKSNTIFRLGTNKNHKRYTKEEAEKFGVVKPNETKSFNHFHLDLSKDFVDITGSSRESIMGDFRSSKDVFKRAMEEISLDTLMLVKDLIVQGSLLNGESHLFKIEQIIPLKREYDELSKKQKNSWCWVKSYKLPLAKFKNELIGVLCSDLAEGMEINKACLAWNKRVDPANYMKATAPITKKQIQEAKEFVEQNGYIESFDRRFATIDDIKVSEILHANAGDGKIKSVSIFDGVKSTSTRHKKSEFEGLEELGIEKFMKDILPGCSSIEVLLQNSHNGNMVSLTTANNPDSKPIFKWSNNYSWTFNGNLAGKSEIKEAVKIAGGNIVGVLRGSVIWNDNGSVGGYDNSDLDSWCEQPNKERIGFSSGFRKDHGNNLSSCSGQLDLDNTGPGQKLGIENIYFADIKKMKDGVYKFWVNQYSSRNSKGFKYEIEFDGEIFNYEYNKPVSGNVQIAEITLKNGQFTIKHLLQESAVSSKEIYGLETNQFHKVNLVCLSPNHWNGETIGNKHYLFMLDGCKSPVSIRSFHNENLISDLLTHRKVMEVLGTTNMIEPSDKQLSGLGFNATVRGELVVKLGGTHKRMVESS